MKRIANLAQHAARRLSKTPLVRVGQWRPLRPLAARVGKIARGSDFTTTVGGVRLTIPGHVDYYTDRFERATRAWLNAHVRPGDTVADVGAHVGFLTLHMAQLVGESGRVYAFEPAPENLSYLRRNVEQNGRGNVVVIPAAVGADSGRRAFYLVEDADMNSLFPDSPLSRAVGTVEVDQLPLDDVVPHLDLAKIDVEGAEIDVLEGMERILSQRPRPLLVVEWSPASQRAAGRGPEELIRSLEGIEYAFAILDEETGSFRSAEEILQMLSAERLPSGWYANLVCTPRERVVSPPVES